MFSLRMIVLLALALASACATPNLIGTQTGDGFKSASYALQLKSEAKLGVFDSSEWLLENVQASGEAGELVSKLGADYERTVSFDTDGDGSYETPHKLHRDELSFRHRRTNAQISLSVLPMDQTMADTDMEVLVQNYVDAVSGGGSVSVSIDPGKTVSSQRRFATRILDAGTFRVAGEPAAGATFEVANVDQLELSKEARWQRARVVLIRAPWQLSAGPSAWPVLIRVLYSSRLESFAAQEEDLANLVNAIDFGPYRAQIDEHADSAQRCIKEPTARMQLLLEISAKGEVSLVRISKAADDPRESLSALSEASCIRRGLAKAVFPKTPAGIKMVWAIGQDSKVLASRGVAADAPAFVGGAWPPVHVTATPASTSGGEVAAPAAAPAPQESAPVPAEPANAPRAEGL